MNNKIRIIITGGTIDNLDYDDEINEPVGQKSLIPGLLNQARTTFEYEIEELMMKDSRFVGEKERLQILNACKDCPENKIVITHGTMTMPDTAKFLGKQKINKTIILTGAMKPANKDKSDALFNLGTAIAAVQTLPNGVYITMHGKIFAWDNVKKNMEKKRFENIK